jgi:hypothetical protein
MTTERTTMTHDQRNRRNDELARQRMFGASFGQIAKSSGLSKTHVYRMLRDVAIICGKRRRSTEQLTTRCTIVPCADGVGYRIVTAGF